MDIQELPDLSFEQLLKLVKSRPLEERIKLAKENLLSLEIVSTPPSKRSQVTNRQKRFNWRGALADIADEIDSVQLQHQINTLWQ